MSNLIARLRAWWHRKHAQRLAEEYAPRVTAYRQLLRIDKKKAARVVGFPMRRALGSTASTSRGERGLMQARGQR